MSAQGCSANLSSRRWESFSNACWHREQPRHERSPTCSRRKTMPTPEMTQLAPWEQDVYRNAVNALRDCPHLLTRSDFLALGILHPGGTLQRGVSMPGKRPSERIAIESLATNLGSSYERASREHLRALTIEEDGDYVVVHEARRTLN